MRYVVELSEALSLDAQVTQQLSQALQLKPEQIRQLARRTPGVISKPLSPENAQRLAKHLLQLHLPARIRSEDGHYVSENPEAISHIVSTPEVGSPEVISPEPAFSIQEPGLNQASVKVMRLAEVHPTTEAHTSSQTSSTIHPVVNREVVSETQSTPAAKRITTAKRITAESKVDLDLPSEFFVSQTSKSHPPATRQAPHTKLPGLGWLSLIPALLTVIAIAIALHFSSRAITQQQARWVLELNTVSISSMLSTFSADLDVTALQEALGRSQPALRQQGVELFLLNNLETREIIGWYGDNAHLLLSSDLRGLIQTQVDRARMETYVAGGQTVPSKVVRSQIEGRPVLLQAQLLPTERNQVLILGLADSSAALQQYQRQQILLAALLPVLLLALFLLIRRLYSRNH